MRTRNAFGDQGDWNGYVSNFTDEAKMLTHCAPVFFMPSVTSLPTNILANGTVALVDTGSRRILVTCAHVWLEFLKFREQNAGAMLSIKFQYGRGALTGILDAALIDCDEQLDLAVLATNLPEAILGHKEFFQIQRFPIADPKPRQPISFLGFPGEARRVSETDVSFGYASFGLTVSDVSDSQILLANNDPRVLRDGAGRLASPINVGGMSGAPAYTRTVSGGFNLAGFVRAGNTSDSDIRLSKASFLQQDGQLLRPKWHPHARSE
jgi:hypothetical protein